MADLSIILCDPDQTYIRRLAAGLKKCFGFPVLLQVYTQAEEMLPLDNVVPGSIVLCGQNGVDKVCAPEDGEGVCHFVRLCEEPGEQSGAEPFWEEVIYKYQPVFRIAERLQRRFPEWQARGTGEQMGSDQKWYGILSMFRHESGIPFVCSIAGELGEGRKVLVIFLAPFCGISELFGLEESGDTERFFLRVRDSGRRAGNSLIPEAISLPGFDILTDPENPEVLYELEECDIQMLITVLEKSGYEAVVWMAEDPIPGISLLLERSERLFCLEKTDTCSICRQKELERFCGKLPKKAAEKKIRRLSLPVYPRMECGQHLLWQWSQSAVGREAKKCLEECDGDGK